MKSIGMNKNVIKRVLPLVKEHMARVSIDTPGKKSIGRLVSRLSPATVDELLHVIEADMSARGRGKEDLGKWGVQVREIVKEIGAEA